MKGKGEGGKEDRRTRRERKEGKGGKEGRGEKNGEKGRRKRREGGKGGCRRDGGKKGRKRLGGGKAEKRTISTTWYANVQPLPFWMNTTTCSPHNILKVKEVLDKEPTHKVLYLLLLVSASPGNGGSSNISGSVTADTGAGTELCRFETHIHNTVCTSSVSNLLFNCIM